MLTDGQTDKKACFFFIASPAGAKLVIWMAL